MMQLRYTLGRLRGRHNGETKTGNEKPTKKKTFPKLRFKFFSKLRQSKHKKKDEVQQAVVIPLASSPVQGSLTDEENNANHAKAVVSDISIDSVERINADTSHVTINVECYDDEFSAPEPLTPAHSLDKLTQNRLSNFSKPFKKSLSNSSLRSFKCYDIRTVWTQTDETVSISESYCTQDYLTAESSEASLNGSELYDPTLDSRMVNKSQSFGSDFGVDDGVTKKQLVNPKLVAIRGRIVDCLTYPIIDSCDVSVCVDLLRYPKLPYLMALAKKLSLCENYFNEVFIDQGGLDCLLELMEETSRKSLTSFYDVLKMLLLAECTRSLLNSTTGRDFLANHGEHIASLVRAVDKNNVMLKMQIFDLLSAICLYSKDGYYLTLEALERYKSWQKLPSRMSLLVNELCKAEPTTYKTTIMALINTIIFSNENIHARMRVRNEFISLNIPETIVTLKCEDDDDLLVQFDVFEDELQADKAALIEMNSGVVNVNDPQSVFNEIFNKVQGTPFYATLLGILNSLLQKGTHNTLCENYWTQIKQFTQAALANDYNNDGKASSIKEVKMQTGGLEDKEIQTDISEVPITIATPLVFELASSEIAHTLPTKPLEDSVGSSVVTTTTPIPTAPSVSSAPPVSRAPPVFSIPPPPPLPSGSLNISTPTDNVGSIPPPPPNLPCPPPIPGSVPPPPGFGQPPPPPQFGRGTPAVPGGFGTAQSPEPPPMPIDTPVPSKKMKSLTWMKIPAYTFKKESVWDQVLNMGDQIHVEYNKLEEYFSQTDTSRTACTTLLPSPQERSNSITRKNSQQNLEVTLLDPKKSMNLNIFLKQFRKPNEAIIALIRAGDGKELGVDKLKGLLKQLPQQDEIDMIQGYDGEIDKLGNAEAFFRELIKVPDFKLRIEIMLLKGDLNSQLGTIRPNIQVLNSLFQSLIANDSLKIFLRFVLHAGNFLNKGSNSGDAIGFRIGSLNKLVMTKSNTPKMTLLHYLVEEAKAKNRQSLKFVEELLEPLQKASRFTLEDMINELSTLKAKVNTFKEQLQNAADEVQSQFASFIEEAENNIKGMDETIQCTQVLSNKLALHYCENEKTFKLNEFLEAFREFCEHVKSCEHEIDTWKIDEQKAEMRKRSQADLAEKRKSSGKSANPSIICKGTEDRNVVNNIVNEIRKGKVLRRLSSRQKSNEMT